VPMPALLIGGNYPFPTVLAMSGPLNVDNAQDPYSTGGGPQRGADPLGLFDSAPALAHWVQSSTTGLVFVPRGNYRMQPGVVQFTQNNVHLVCAPGTRFIIDDSLGNSGGDGFLMQDVDGCSISGLNNSAPLLSAPSTRVAGYSVHIKGGDATVKLPSTQISGNRSIVDVDMDSQFNGVLIDDSTVGCWDAIVGNPSRRGRWRNFAAGGKAIVINSPGGVGHQVLNIGAWNLPAGPLGGPALNIKGTGDLRVENFDTYGFVNGVLIDNGAAISTPGSGGGVSHMMFLNSQWDSTGQAVGADCIRIVPGNTVQPAEMEFLGCWCGTGYNGLFVSGLSGSSPRWAVSFQGTIIGSAQYGVRGVSSPLNTNVFIDPTLKTYSNAAGDSLFT
jgi:hypothetical protein